MDANNLAVVRGIVTGVPHTRRLRSGEAVIEFVVATRSEGRNAGVPVVASGAAAVGAGDQVVVLGHVRQRFFRADGVTRSRTELVAGQVFGAGRRRAAAEALAAAAELLAP